MPKKRRFFLVWWRKNHVAIDYHNADENQVLVIDERDLEALYQELKALRRQLKKMGLK